MAETFEHMFGMLLAVLTVVVSVYAIYLSRRMKPKDKENKEKDQRRE